MSKIINFVFCLVVLNTVLFGQDLNKYKNINWRIYHSLNWRAYVDYHSEEWKNMPIEEKNSLLQIPQTELDSMSTYKLIEACIDCYFCRRIGLYSSIEEYYKNIYDGFNGFRELLNRKDTGEQLMAYYKKMDIKKKTYSPADLPMKDQVQIIEYFIAHPRIVQNLNSINVGELISLLKNKYEEKSNMIEEYQEGDIISNIYTIAKLLEKKDITTMNKLHGVEHVEIFLKSGLFLTQETRIKIINMSKEF